MKNKIETVLLYIGIIIAIRFVGSFAVRYFSNSIPNLNWISMVIYFAKIAAQVFMAYLIVKKIFFEKTMQEVPLPDGMPKPFDYKLNSIRLLSAGIIGLILSGVYYMNLIGCDFWEHQCNDIEKAMNASVVNAQTLYYGGVAFLVLISSIFLRFRKKFGLYIFSLVIILIAASFFIPDSLFLPQYVDPNAGVDTKSVSLFLGSINAALMGSIIMFGLPIIGTIIYFWIIIKNLSNINKWAEFLGISVSQERATKAFSYLQWLFIICIVLGVAYFFFMKYQQNRSQKYWSEPSSYGEPVTIPGF